AGSFRSTRLAVNTNIAEVQLDSQAEELVVAVTQEALTNVVRHSSATQIELELASHLDEIELKIADDGTGTSEPFGFGLRSLSERVEQSGGLMRAEAHGGIGEGFALAVHLPRKNVDGYTNYSYR
ncbi:sensor histidine kinase, partial [Corynebacterium stationis]